MADLPMYDVTARKAHQWTMVTLVAAAFVFEGAYAPLLLAIAGTIMLAGRFWWPADLVRQLVWRVLQPAGILRRHEVHEDRETRRLARVLGGAVWFVSAALLVAKLSVLAWALAFAIAIMVALDASVDFCTLCSSSCGSSGLVCYQKRCTRGLTAQWSESCSRCLKGFFCSRRLPRC
jgi:hypothetical protein